MPKIHVCPLSRLGETVAASGASHVATIITAGTPVVRPPSIAAERHAFIGCNDISAPVDGLTHPADEHVRALLGFARAWDRRHPMVIHCWAGISRSTAAALIAVAALRPDLDEHDIAAELRRRSPTAFPNTLLVRLGDAMLGRDGRLAAAARSIGRGREATEGAPFFLDVGGREIAS